MDRRKCIEYTCALMAGAWSLSLRAQAGGAPPGKLRSIAVLDFELIDEQNNPLTKAAQEVRLRAATGQLRRELGERRLYAVADPAPSEELQRKLRSQQENLFQCADCSDQIGRLLGVDLVMTPWVQKISELILNLNVQIYDLRSRKIMFSKSVDMRGNTDVSWTRAVSFLVSEMVDQRARNPGYGQ
jgi:hypothetical protein